MTITESSPFTADVDFENFNQELSFNQSNEMHCVNITILKDGVDEVDEYFLVNLVLQYAPFDIPLDTYNATIIDSGKPHTIIYRFRITTIIDLGYSTSIHGLVCY